MEQGKTTARWQRGAVIACGLFAFAAAEVADAQGRLRGDLKGLRGERAGERTGAAKAAASSASSPAPSPNDLAAGPGGASRAPPGPTSGFPGLPDGAGGVRPLPGPTPASSTSAAAPGSGHSASILAAPAAAGLAAPARAATPKSVAASSAPPGADGGASSGGASSGGSGSSGRITEIIPAASTALGAQASAARSAGVPAAGGLDASASADPCVNVFVRSSKVDGREVMSVDLHGDGLIKAAVPPQLAGQLLARAGPATGDARTACVPPALARHLFDPVVNLAAVDPAVRMVRVGDRWVLAGSRAPEPVAKAPAPVQLAATTTRGAAKKPTKRSVRAPAKAVKRTPTQAGGVASVGAQEKFTLATLMVSRGAALGSGVLALLGAAAAVSFMPLPPPGPTPGDSPPEPVAKAQAPVQLAAATTRGAAKKPTKRSVRTPAKAVKRAPMQVARVNFP